MLEEVSPQRDHRVKGNAKLISGLRACLLGTFLGFAFQDSY
jgi:hypothetical protein